MFARVTVGGTLSADNHIQNIAKAQKEIERLEAEAKEAPTTSSNQSTNRRGKDSKKTEAKTNGNDEETKQNGDSAADQVADDLKAAKIAEEKE
jgi:hypothetical protein